MTFEQTFSNSRRMLSDATDFAFDATRKTLLAGLGLVAVAQEEFAAFYDGLVSEGRNVEEGRSRTVTARAFAETRQETAQARTEAVAAVERAEEAGRRVETASRAIEERVAATVTTVLQRMNVPTREDIDALRASVERLDQKTAELRAA